MTTVICLDDYHSLDRKGRSAAGVTALDPKAQNFELMYDQVRERRCEGVPASRPQQQPRVQLPGCCTAHAAACASGNHRALACQRRSRP